MADKDKGRIGFVLVVALAAGEVDDTANRDAADTRVADGFSVGQVYGNRPAVDVCRALAGAVALVIRAEVRRGANQTRMAFFVHVAEEQVHLPVAVDKDRIVGDVVALRGDVRRVPDHLGGNRYVSVGAFHGLLGSLVLQLVVAGSIGFRKGVALVADGLGDVQIADFAVFFEFPGLLVEVLRAVEQIGVTVGARETREGMLSGGFRHADDVRERIFLEVVDLQEHVAVGGRFQTAVPVDSPRVEREAVVGDGVGFDDAQQGGIGIAVDAQVKEALSVPLLLVFFLEGVGVGLSGGNLVEFGGGVGVAGILPRAVLVEQVRDNGDGPAEVLLFGQVVVFGLGVGEE